MSIFAILVVIVSFSLLLQGIMSVWQMISGWELHAVTHKSERPEKLSRPKTHFTIIVPCRHEENVVGETLRQLAKISYPKRLFEILVPMAKDDEGTIAEVQRVVVEYPHVRIAPVIFTDGPINKPHGLNKAFNKAKGDYVVIFDAEDSVNPELLRVINTIIMKEGRKIIQIGVDLINWSSNWFSIHAVLEYYLWFRSRLHWFADRSVITLGGVGVFLPREALVATNGWDELCLTEDAKLGIDCSVNKFEFYILSDPTLAIKEEVPILLSAFIKQRTRWIQGFFQIFTSARWMDIPGKRKRFYFLSLVFFNIYQLMLQLWFVVALIASQKLPLIIALISITPLMLLFIQIAINAVGITQMLWERKQIYMLPFAFLLFVATLIPYQVLISYATARAFWRSIKGNSAWEKTPHFNVHRMEEYAPALVPNK